MSESVKEIAARLNIGLEHVLFVDDSPVECHQVARALPMVTIIRLPEQPERFICALLEEGLFDGLSFSQEDRNRAELYRQVEQAEQLRGRSASLEDFYRELEMEVSFHPVQANSVSRAAQLSQKTNQFNVTTIRYSDSEIAARAKDHDWLVTTIRVKDRFGDNGIVALTLARFCSDELDIDTLLMSCRVFGRTVETAMLAYLCDRARRRGALRIRGKIIPTSKNGPSQDLYETHGFQRVSVGSNGESVWLLDLSIGAIAYPKWLRIVAENPQVDKESPVTL
jgi:FkbH-like protein